MKKEKTKLINRKDYDRIRKMDHAQMSALLKGEYDRGYRDGVNSIQAPPREEVSVDI